MKRVVAERRQVPRVVWFYSSRFTALGHITLDLIFLLHKLRTLANLLTLHGKTITAAWEVLKRRMFAHWLMVAFNLFWFHTDSLVRHREIWDATIIFFRLDDKLVLTERRSFVEDCRSSFTENTLMPLPCESKRTDCTSIFFSLDACVTSEGHFRILADFTALLL